MKTIIAFVLMMLTTLSFQAQELKAMTYNLRYANENDGNNSWSNRKEELVALVNYYLPDFIGTQEGLQSQLDYIQANTNYKYVGVGRDNGKTKGEYAAIFYNKQKLSLISQATFWLSTTPNVPSKGWDAALNRVCTYALFETKDSKKKFLVFNAHFDHIGVKAREESASLMLLKSKELNPKGYPVFITGDFNLTPESTPIQIFSKAMNDSYTHSLTKPYGPQGTFTGFTFKAVPNNRIDYIFTSANIQVMNYRTITDFNEERFPSDHLPVVITAKFE